MAAELINNEKGFSQLKYYPAGSLMFIHPKASQIILSLIQTLDKF